MAIITIEHKGNVLELVDDINEYGVAYYVKLEKSVVAANGKTVSSVGYNGDVMAVFNRTDSEDVIKKNMLSSYENLFISTLWVEPEFNDDDE
ncbi:hypothetical protein BIY29_08600 [Brenneria alni]|uniref:Uncharacterized protein n=1 Tax=Brenneria alni TaxID=71656 RepID=A0A421DPN1_9GAMM|nr:hypothetical protein [Brenneria alni]RLM24765.1 hypothetical protein BIY29_08600 [Brenneria alni]